MAIDTADKRSSALMVSLPWRGRLPQPDGAAFSVGDRQHVGLMYSGISAGAALPEDPQTACFLPLLGVG